MAAATAARARRRRRDMDCPGGRPTHLVDTSAGRGHDQSRWERAPRPVAGRRPGDPERQRAAQLCVGMAALTVSHGRWPRDERVSWAVYTQANIKKPTAVRMARGAFRARERSLSSIRSPRLAAPMPIAQAAAYRQGRSTATCVHRSINPSGRLDCRRSPWHSGPGSCKVGMGGHRNPARSSGRVALAGMMTVQLAAARAVLARVARWTCWPP
jgi:hypothetical protein